MNLNCYSSMPLVLAALLEAVIWNSGSLWGVHSLNTLFYSNLWNCYSYNILLLYLLIGSRRFFPLDKETDWWEGHIKIIINHFSGRDGYWMNPLNSESKERNSEEGWVQVVAVNCPKRAAMWIWNIRYLT